MFAARMFCAADGGIMAFVIVRAFVLLALAFGLACLVGLGDE